MPATLSSSGHLTPKSTLRHRPLGSEVTLEEPPRVPRASLTQTRKPAPSTTTSIPIPARKLVRPSSSSWKQRLLVVGIGIGMILAVIAVVLGQLLIGWIGTTLDMLHYGYPRTYQTDAVVGHHDSHEHPSHFIALNQTGQIEVLEFPGGDATHAQIYLGPHLYGQNANLVPVTLQFVDTRHDRHPDMIVEVQGQDLIFPNSQGMFHAPTGSS
ncbi:MAG: hypothetical protein JO031_12330 [Ktedonobacteraceae bacterium]|nr:hypothetical protein [Ktedonobacteraceae bacterium]